MQLVSSAWIQAQAQRLVPESFIKIELELSSGNSKTFTKSNIMSFEHTMEANLSSGVLPTTK
jgi:hypothetical protein